MKNLKKLGQFTIPIVLTMGGMIAAAVGGVYAIKNDTDRDVAAVSERTARLETSLPNISQDLASLDDRFSKMQNDLNEIKILLNKYIK